MTVVPMSRRALCATENVAIAPELADSLVQLLESARSRAVPRPLVFGPFRLLLAERRLERRGKTVRIGGRALDILIALAAKPGRVVSKAELAEAAWPGMVVEEANLRFHIGVLRKVLDGGLTEGSFITTVAGRGYCLSAPIDQPSLARTASEVGQVDGANPTVVGRDAEEAELASLLNQAVASEAQLAFVTGEAGIGLGVIATARVWTAMLVLFGVLKVTVR